MWITVIAILIYLEILQVGLFFMLKGSAEKPGLSIFIPVYGLKYITRTGKIKILSVPVEKPFGFFAELLVIAFLCALYWKWGVDNLDQGVHLARADYGSSRRHLPRIVLSCRGEVRVERLRKFFRLEKSCLRRFVFPYSPRAVHLFGEGIFKVIYRRK